MRALASSVLGLEVLVLILVVPVAITVFDVDAAIGITGGLLLIALCIVAIGGLGRGWGYQLGWVVQALAIALGFVVPTMFLLGGIFALLYFFALRLARKVEAEKAARGEPPAAPLSP